MTGDIASYCGPGPGPDSASTLIDRTERCVGVDDSVISGASILPASFPFQPFVRSDSIYCRAASSPEKRYFSLRRRRRRNRRTVDEIHNLLANDKLKDLKSCLRASHWTPGDGVRSRLWQMLCSFHTKDKATMSLLYWDTVKQIYGTLGVARLFFCCIVSCRMMTRSQLNV